jgi:hypothetical protein
MPFPPRNAASDAIIRNLYRELTAGNVASGGANRCMITVLTTDETDGVPRNAFIATSSPAGVAGSLRSAINNLAGQGIYGGVVYHVLHFQGANIMIHAPGGPGARVPGDYRLAGPRHCAEPKAIEAAAATGARLSGMSTIWWGNNANPYPDPANNPNGIFALPCDICQANEAWIMERADEARLQGRGVGRRAAESPI